MQESEISGAAIIVDKGFASESNFEALEAEDLQYIIPLPRNSHYIDYQKIKTGDKKDFDGYFIFEERVIRYYFCLSEKGRKVFVFLDEELKNRKINDYVKRIENTVSDYSMKRFFEKQYAFGTDRHA